MKTSPGLKPGDQIRIVSPAKAIEPHHLEYAKTLLTDRGFEVTLGKHCAGQYNYFSGTIHDRLEDFQSALDDPEVKAILCARGGYGCIQLVDKLDWSKFEKNPKWIIGFSDITVFHQQLQHQGFQSVHGSMPLNFEENSEDAIDTLTSAITAQPYTINAKPDEHNIPGSTKGDVIGGNLSIVYSLLGTDLQPDMTDKILFIEDLAEHVYHIDRMFHALGRSGVLLQLNGVIIGGMTDIKDTQIPYGCSYEEVILSHLSRYDIPVCFNFPAGHIDDNRAIVLGKEATLTINETEVWLAFREQ
jgi:muramoyltetrapeptide carboxypeptidase